MPVLERSALADSPLADLHAIASELGIDGFRRLRKEDLIDAIVTRQGGDEGGAPNGVADEDAPARPRRRRGGRGRSRTGRDVRCTLVGEERELTRRLADAGARVRQVSTLALEDAALAFLPEDPS